MAWTGAVAHGPIGQAEGRLWENWANKIRGQWPILREGMRRSSSNVAIMWVGRQAGGREEG